jgi:hypothetical protein
MILLSLCTSGCLAASLIALFGGVLLDQSDHIKKEADELLSILSMEHLTPDVLDSGLKRFSPDSKNEVVSRVAQMPAPPGHLLTRLTFILTDENKPVVEKIYIANLHSQLPDARKFSLYGLEELSNPDLERYAKGMLHDRDDGVLYAACDILLPKAKKDEALWKSLQKVYVEHKDDVTIPNTMNLLRGSSIAASHPPK